MRTFLLALLSLALLSNMAFGDDDEPPLHKELNEQVVMLPIKIGSQEIELETTLYKPDGPGPFPLVVINHGHIAGNPSLQERARYPLMAKEFMKRGYLVALPMRSGYSKSGGDFHTFSVDKCDVTQWVRDQSDEVTKVIELLRARKDVDGSRILVIGHSLGGFVGLALAERNVSGVKAILSFAGGIAWSSKSCNLVTTLNDAYTNLGSDAKVDSLWFVGENDPTLAIDMMAKLYERYQAAGGRAVFVRYAMPQYASHGLFGTRQSFDNIWWPKAEPFLKAHGLPTAVINPQYIDPPAQKASGYADPHDYTALPTNSDSCRSLYRKYLDEYTAPRAFAFSVNVNGEGGCGGAANSDDPSFYALKNCQKVAKHPCQLYLVDDVVVWPKAASQTARASEH